MLVSRPFEISSQPAQPLAAVAEAGITGQLSDAGHVHPFPAADSVGAVALTYDYTCDSGVAVREAVYLSAADTVDEANATNVSKAPCVGLVAAKPNATTASVQALGPLAGFVGLTPGATYYLNTTDGTITNDVSAFPAGAVVQKIGHARSATVLVLEIDRDYVVL